MVSSLLNPNTNTPEPIANAYTYDQLHRLTHSKSFTNFDATANAWQLGSSYQGMYENNFTYDANGNIETQLRKDAAGAEIDSLRYHYHDGSFGRLRNRLYHVNDAVPETDHEDDIDDQGPFDPNNIAQINTVNNYGYDPLGQLIRDDQEGITAITWRNDGKIRDIFRANDVAEPRKELSFDYSPYGHRLSKKVYQPGSGNDLLHADYYIRDAQGNVMATYRMKVDPVEETVQYAVTERPIYGSDRLGLYRHEQVVHPAPPTTTAAFAPIHRGERQYELKNHLGNVMAVVSGHKTPVESTTTPGTVGHYLPQIMHAADYSPFGVTRLSYEPDYTSGTEGGEPHPLKPDLMWCMDGDGTEKYGSGHNATLFSVNPSADRNSDANKALTTSGNPQTASYMQINDHADLDFGANDFTVSIWVHKLNGNVSWNNAVAVGKWQTGGQLQNCEWYINMSNGSSGQNNTTQFTIVSGSTRYNANGPALSMNNWHHLVGVREGDHIRFYVNGNLVNSTFVGSASINNVTNQHLRVGRTGANNYTNAGFDELAIYNRALSAAEVGDLFALGCDDLDSEEGALAERRGYRYGFNGQEKDDEVAGSGNSYTALYWQYDSRLGRRWNIDPKVNPEISPYATFANNPLIFKDILGDTITLTNEFQSSEDLMNRWNTFTSSKAGKSFMKKYNVGGERGDVSVIIDVRSFTEQKSYPDPVTLAYAVSGNSERGLGVGDALGEGEYLKFHLKFIDKTYEIGSNDPKNFFENSMTILHEIQHVRLIDFGFLMTNTYKYSAVEQHSIMKANMNQGHGVYPANGIRDFRAERWQFLNEISQGDFSEAELNEKVNNFKD